MNSKNSLAIIFFFAFISLKVNSQSHVNYGLKEGMCKSQMSSDGYDGFQKSGFIGGGFLKISLKGNWSALTEIIYIEKGSRHRSDSKNGNFDSYFLELTYLETPLLLQYNIDRVGIQLGPGYGFLLRTKEILTINGKDAPNPKGFNSNEISFNCGLNYTFSSRFGLNLRYTSSLVPVRKLNPVPSKWYEYGQKNALVAICLSFEFGSEGSIWK